MSKLLFCNGNVSALSSFLAKTKKLDSVKGTLSTWPWILLVGVLLLIVAATLLVVCIRKRNNEVRGDVSLTENEDAPMIKIGSVSRIGARVGQQDRFAVTPVELFPDKGLLAVVADGMGGLADGDKVSQLVVSTMVEGYMDIDKPSENTLMALVSEANLQVNDFLGDEGIGKSGSTLVAALVCDDSFYYISVGDSRIALYRGGQLIQLNREHTYRHELQLFIMNGVYDLPDDAADRADHLTSYIGMGYLRDVDVPESSVRIVPGDKLILMSDGVYNALSEDELAEALECDAQSAADQIDRMIAKKAFSNQDNYTALILEV